MDWGRLARRFPMVARARPPCGPLAERVRREVRDLSRAAAERPGRGGLALAAAAQNKAALIASDCGLTDLARSLCWRQFEAYERRLPLDGQAARYAMEPLVNVARLQVRSGEGVAPHRSLDGLYSAAVSCSDATVDGRGVSLRGFTRTDDDQAALRRWLWAVVVADGTRALVSAGRWASAVDHLERRRGIGLRLLDGRQVAVVARCLEGDARSAGALLRQSDAPTAWERAVAACLSAFCGHSDVAAMVESYLALDVRPDLLAFRIRLGLTVLDLAGDGKALAVTAVGRRVVDEAVAAADGYAARQVLGHDRCRAGLNAAEERELSAAVEAAGLGAGALPDRLAADLLAAFEAAEAVVDHCLATERASTTGSYCIPPMAGM